jgi:DNA-binding NarL/FixJ family response regulator
MTSFSFGTMTGRASGPVTGQTTGQTSGLITGQASGLFQRQGPAANPAARPPAGFPAVHPATLPASHAWRPPPASPESRRAAPTRIAIVDDHAIVRIGLRRYLSEQADFQVVGEAGDGRAALELVRSTGVDVMLLDIAMPGRNGVDTLTALQARSSPPAVLIFSGLPVAAYATCLMRLGAAGYLGKDCEPGEIILAIRTVAGGRRYLSAEVAQRLAGQSIDGPQAAHEILSARELQVLLRLAAGESNGHVAAALCLSVKTVSTYRSRVLEKLQVASNSALTHYAMHHGLIE